MINRAAVVGAGILGTGIAQVLAQAGTEVELWDACSEQLARSARRVDENLRLLVTHQALSLAAADQARARIRLAPTLAAATAGVDMVIEAIPERLAPKLELYAELEQRVTPKAIIASNTSTFPIHALSGKLVHPGRFLISHFFNPAELVPLVEIIAGELTDEEVVGTVLELLRQAGKTPIRLRKDIPGFVANRLQAAMLREALHLVDAGVVSPEELDTVVASGIGFRWAFLGPLEIADFGGLDTWQYVTENLFPLLDNSREPPAVLREHVARGELGVKSGRGFYRYDAEDVPRRLAARDARFLALRQIKQER